MNLPASKTRINKAGDVLRQAALGNVVAAEDLRAAGRSRSCFRASHGCPLTSVAMALRHHVQNAADGICLDLGQRLKQLPTITNKLVRMPKTKLARLQDIGGRRSAMTSSLRSRSRVDEMRLGHRKAPLRG